MSQEKLPSQFLFGTNAVLEMLRLKVEELEKRIKALEENESSKVTIRD